MRKNSLVFLVLVCFGILARFLELDEILETSWLHKHIITQGTQGILLFLVLTACFSAIGLPRQLLSFAAGYAFGPVWGVFWSIAGLAAGCGMGFYTARLTLCPSNLPNKIQNALARITPFLQYKPFLMALIIRLVPVGNNALTNIAAGVTGVPALAFIAGSAVGYLPQTIIFVLLGSGVQMDSTWQTSISALLFLVASALGAWLFRRFKKHVHAVQEDAPCPLL